MFLKYIYTNFIYSSRCLYSILKRQITSNVSHNYCIFGVHDAIEYKPLLTKSMEKNNEQVATNSTTPPISY